MGDTHRLDHLEKAICSQVDGVEIAPTSLSTSSVAAAYQLLTWTSDQRKCVFNSPKIAHGGCRSNAPRQYAQKNPHIPTDLEHDALLREMGNMTSEYVCSSVSDERVAVSAHRNLIALISKQTARVGKRFIVFKKLCPENRSDHIATWIMRHVGLLCLHNSRGGVAARGPKTTYISKRKISELADNPSYTEHFSAWGRFLDITCGWRIQNYVDAATSEGTSFAAISPIEKFEDASPADIDELTLSLEKAFVKAGSYAKAVSVREASYYGLRSVPTSQQRAPIVESARFPISRDQVVCNLKNRETLRFCQSALLRVLADSKCREVTPTILNKSATPVG